MPRFTFRDLLVVAAISPLVFAAFLSANAENLETQRRIKCASNLKQLGMATMIYANENKGAFPRALYDPDNAESVSAFTNPKAGDPFTKDGPLPNDVTASAYLLLRTADINHDVFICPSTKNEQLKFGPPEVEGNFAADVSETSNFPSLKNLSYSFTNPYPSPDARKKGLKLNYTLSADYAIASDLNPGGDALLKLKADDDAPKEANSPNHGGEGQNVLYADGHVEWTATPFCGMKRGDDEVKDNVFTRHLGDGAQADSDPVMGPAMDQFDSVLLPSADYEKRLEHIRKTRPAAKLPAKLKDPAKEGL
jgi:prepilin-type processing-associated H-X9-DG protein